MDASYGSQFNCRLRFCQLGSEGLEAGFQVGHRTERATAVEPSQNVPQQMDGSYWHRPS